MVVYNNDVIGSFINCLIFGCCGKQGIKRCRKKAFKKTRNEFFDLYDACPNQYSWNRLQNPSPGLWLKAYYSACGQVYHENNFEFLGIEGDDRNQFNEGDLEVAVFYFNVSNIDGDMDKINNDLQKIIEGWASYIQVKYDVWGVEFTYDTETCTTGDFFPVQTNCYSNIQTKIVNSNHEEIQFDNSRDALIVKELLRRSTSYWAGNSYSYDLTWFSPFFDSMDAYYFNWSGDYYHRRQPIPSYGYHQIDLLNQFYRDGTVCDDDPGGCSRGPLEYPKQFIKLWLGMEQVGECVTPGTYGCGGDGSVHGVDTELVRNMDGEEFIVLMTLSGDIATQVDDGGYFDFVLNALTFFVGFFLNPLAFVATQITMGILSSGGGVVSEKVEDWEETTNGESVENVDHNEIDREMNIGLEIEDEINIGKIIEREMDLSKDIKK